MSPCMMLHTVTLPRGSWPHTKMNPKRYLWVVVWGGVCPIIQPLFLSVWGRKRVWAFFRPSAPPPFHQPPQTFGAPPPPPANICVVGGGGRGQLGDFSEGRDRHFRGPKVVGPAGHSALCFPPGGPWWGPSRPSSPPSTTRPRPRWQILRRRRRRRSVLERSGPPVRSVACVYPAGCLEPARRSFSVQRSGWLHWSTGRRPHKESCRQVAILFRAGQKKSAPPSPREVRFFISLKAQTCHGLSIPSSPPISFHILPKGSWLFPSSSIASAWPKHSHVSKPRPPPGPCHPLRQLLPLRGFSPVVLLGRSFHVHSPLNSPLKSCPWVLFDRSCPVTISQGGELTREKGSDRSSAPSKSSTDGILA